MRPDRRAPALRRTLLAAASPLALAGALAGLLAGAAAAQTSVTLGGETFVNQGLVGVGRISASQRDKYGETFGSMSALTFDAKAWRKTSSGYTGTLFALPDRGYNAVGTTDYSNRFNTLSFTFQPYTGAAATAQQTQVNATLSDTTLLTEANGTSLTGLDAASARNGGVRAATATLPALPQAYNGKISLDPEGIARLSDGSFFISDEYGPNIYHFSSSGKLVSAITPPTALVPYRNGVPDYQSNNPAAGQPAPTPADPTTGRQNNQGLEGLTLMAGGTQLAALLQSATRQDGGTGGSSATRYNTRLLIYNVANPDQATLSGHYVVQLPRFTTASGATNVAAQSEMLALNEKQFLVLSRDSGNGQGLSGSTSRYRSIDLIDISNATNLVGSAYEGTTPVAPGGTLVASVTPVTYTSFVNINDNAQLNRFGLHNGTPNDRNNLSEKWEALGLLPALDAATPNDFFLFVGNDNDFLTTNGFQVGAAYNAGADVDTMLLVYRLTLPTYVDPVAVESLYQTALPLARGISDAALDLARTTSHMLEDHLDALHGATAGDGGLSAGNMLGLPVSVFVSGDLSYLRPDDSVGSGDAEGDTRAVMLGAEAQVAPSVVAGLAFGYGRTDASVKGAGSADLSAKSISPYVAARAGALYGDLSFTYAWTDYDKISRDTGAYGLTARGETDGRSYSVGANIGYDLGAGPWSYGPVAGVRYTRVEIDGYTETDAIHMNATLPDETVKSWDMLLGGKLARRFTTDSVAITPELRLGYEWSRVSGGDTFTATLANRPNSTLARVTRSFSDLDEDGVRVGVGLTVDFGALSWRTGYDGKFSGDQKSHNVLTSLRYSF